jgi:hypothetical protein
MINGTIICVVKEVTYIHATSNEIEGTGNQTNRQLARQTQSN